MIKQWKIKLCYNLVWWGTLNYSDDFYKCELISLYLFSAPDKIVYDIFGACLCGDWFFNKHVYFEGEINFELKSWLSLLRKWV